MGRGRGMVIKEQIKTHMDKAKVEQDPGWEVELGGAGSSGVGEMETTVLEQQLKKSFFTNTNNQSLAVIINKNNHS